MTWKRRFGGSVLAFVGFILSPLSWWNDAFVNLPLALAFGWLIALFYKPAFEPAVVLGYWLTNIVGLILLQKGATQALAKGERRKYSKRDLVRDLAISLAYTALIIALFKLNVLQPLTNYLPGPLATELQVSIRSGF